ncbi:MAG TPA: type II toxin-antitoxin system VapC family toxin [Anaerolineales bacterium]|nr:type II toxin-antitoxin system VapC family toxin [Anaerolineales bacterium]
MRHAELNNPMTDPAAYVLDSFALLAYLQDEAAASRIERLLDHAAKEKCRLFLSIISLGEILYITERRGGVAKAQDVLALVQQLPIQVLPANEETVFAAAHIKANHSISYADSFVVAIAIETNGAVVTADPEFHAIETLVHVEWLLTA